jgi:hypothetical protein
MEFSSFPSQWRTRSHILVRHNVTLAESKCAQRKGMTQDELFQGMWRDVVKWDGQGEKSCKAATPSRLQSRSCSLAAY